ncbi:MAG: Maff2 family protein [Lachnospiraceae bacterium]|nr:Maff2 family protein [Lachnospiraceae bacterium]
MGWPIPGCPVLKKTNSNKLGIRQLMAGGGVALIGITLVPLLSGLF